MGFNVVIERDIKNWTITMIYKCSNCNSEIVRTPPIRREDIFDIDWGRVSPICPCGEKLLTLVTKVFPMIDEMENIEI